MVDRTHVDIDHVRLDVDLHESFGCVRNVVNRITLSTDTNRRKIAQPARNVGGLHAPNLGKLVDRRPLVNDRPRLGI